MWPIWAGHSKYSINFSQHGIAFWSSNIQFNYHIIMNDSCIIAIPSSNKLKSWICWQYPLHKYLKYSNMFMLSFSRYTHCVDMLCLVVLRLWCQTIRRYHDMQGYCRWNVGSSENANEIAANIQNESIVIYQCLNWYMCFQYCSIVEVDIFACWNIRRYQFLDASSKYGFLLIALVTHRLLIIKWMDLCGVVLLKCGSNVLCLSHFCIGTNYHWRLLPLHRLLYSRI